ncbi:MAG: hypothetical protein K9N11_02910 [Lentisphaeria bacterium]|nr:hypothetical protein [Candidatus Neomarinimicrobiota bacterium]MCF7841782.1 hypothetical protein [Lentisphaeria bacterium]
MGEKVIIYEPADVSGYGPLVMLRHLADLPYGIYSNWDRARRVLPEVDLRLWGRPLLQHVNAETHPDSSINEKTETAYYLHGGVPAWHYPLLLEKLQSVKALVWSGEVIAARLDDAIQPTPYFFTHLKELPAEDVSSELDDIPYHFWSFLDLRQTALEFDSTFWLAENDTDNGFDPLLPMNQPERIHIHSDAHVSTGVFLDATAGPIVVDASVEVPPFVTLRGPLYLGTETQVKDGASLRGSIIGASCRVGGEVANSIFLPFVNKAHAGFVGTSMIGSWVNLGAQTTTSNLKNNYGSIRVRWGIEEYNTHQQFLGATLGDHTKTAIGSLLNTGCVSGIFVNYFQPGLSDKFIPSFTWGNGRYEINKALQTAAQVVQRRNQELSHAMEALIRDIWQHPETAFRW